MKRGFLNTPKAKKIATQSVQSTSGDTKEKKETEEKEKETQTMKRGFLNTPKAKKSAALSAQSLQSTSGATNENKETEKKEMTKKLKETSSRDVQIVAFYPNFGIDPIARTQELPSNKNTLNPNALICARIPATPKDTYGSTACVMYASTLTELTRTPKFPSAPKPFGYTNSNWPYEIRDVEGKGKGLVATRPLRTGDLILIERALVILPALPDLSTIECPLPVLMQMQGKPTAPPCILQPMLDVALGRMSEEDREKYLGLYNARGESMPLLAGIWKTNVFAFCGLGGPGEGMSMDQDSQFGAVFKEMSLVNHSCRPNCTHSFDKASFSFELRATKPIAVGEEICYAYYSRMEKPAAFRQDHLRKIFGFTCACLSCSTASTSDAVRSSLSRRMVSLQQRYVMFLQGQGSKAAAQAAYNDCLSLLKDLKEEGLDGYSWACDTHEIRVAVCKRLEMIASSEAERRKWREARRVASEEFMKIDLACEGSSSQIAALQRGLGGLSL